jgi:5,10-methenyltetrahydromethanopterin hydrogenase
MSIAILVIISIGNIFPKISIQVNDKTEMNNMYDLLIYHSKYWLLNGTLFMEVLNKIDEKYSTFAGQTDTWVSYYPEFSIIFYDFSRQEHLKFGNFSMVPFPKKGEIYISEGVAKDFDVFSQYF